MQVDFRRPLTSEECETAFICVLGVLIVVVLVVCALLGWPDGVQ